MGRQYMCLEALNISALPSQLVSEVTFANTNP